MSRAIRFRVWDKKHLSFVNEPYYAISLLGTLQIEGHSTVEPRRYVVIQCTGLQDRNTKDVYEGDILKGEDGYIALVEAGFSTPDVSICLLKELDRDQYALATKVDHLEVIGNVYENSELLERKL